MNVVNNTHAWLAAHIYYAEPWDTFLTTAVAPFIAQLQATEKLERFFFIRYWERGPHIRLRLKITPEILHNIQSDLRAYFQTYFAAHPSDRLESFEQTDLFPNNSIQFISYEPEIIRYGGLKGISIAEMQFQASSQAVLSRMYKSKTWSYEAALGSAVQLHLTFAHALGMDLLETGCFFDFVFTRWLGMTLRLTHDSPEQIAKEQYQNIMQVFQDSFFRQQEALLTHHRLLWDALQTEASFDQKWLNTWRQNMIRIKQQLQQVQQANQLQPPAWFQPNPDCLVPLSRQMLWPILESYVHMTNNRLGILNRDEAYLGYLIRKSLNSLA